jgi:hypothetical protein
MLLDYDISDNDLSSSLMGSNIGAETHTHTHSVVTEIRPDALEGAD